jgi:hypothetical protein
MLRKSIQALVGTVFLFGMLFKFMHWPGAGPLLLFSIFGMTLLLLDRIIQHRNPKLLSRHNISCLLGVIYICAIAFKVMHLPGAGVMLVVSMVGFTLVLMEFAYSMRKSNYAILPFLFSLTLFFALFKIMHWPMPPYVLYGSYFIFAFLLPVLLFMRGRKLKSSYGDISQHFMALGLLTFVLFLVEAKLHFYPECWGTEVYELRIVQTLLIAGIILFIQMTPRMALIKSTFKNEYRLLKSLQGMYLIVLVMMILLSRQ